MKRLLLTGFEPFLDFQVNPTMEIAEQLDGVKINHYEITCKILSVEFSKAGVQLREAMEEIKPDVVLSLGLAGGRHKITPERVAINCNDGAPDNSNYTPQGEPIFEDGPDGIFTTLPIEEMVRRLTNAGLPAEISNTAGTHLCNNVMYHGLYYLHTYSHVSAGFIHIPASHELALKNNRIPSWSSDDLMKAIKICIECV